MKFTLVESEIQQAIQDFVAKMITLKPGASIKVEVKATRGSDGVTADVDVSMAPAVSAIVPEKPPVLAPATKPEPEVKTEEQLPLPETSTEEPTPPNENAPVQGDNPFAEPGAEAGVAGKSIFG